MGQFTDLTGRRFGRWTVLGRVKTDARATIWRCRCDCGTIANVRGGHLCDGSTLSCGCYKRELTKKRLTKHGHHDEKLYKVWLSINQRCTNTNSKDYPHYGGRGIKRCDAWNDYETFRDWSFSSGYAPGLTIERLNVNGDYCPENCAWIPKAEQGKNTTRTLNNRKLMEARK